MRLKTFHAKSMSAVMAQVRNEMGPDAIIVQIDEGKSGVRVTAAIEGAPSREAPRQAPDAGLTPVQHEQANFPRLQEYDKADIAAVLNHHGLPYETADFMRNAATAVALPSLPEAFAAALEAVIAFDPISHRPVRPLMLVGPPGVGKTVAAAKLVADALLHEKTVHLISTDTVKAGGIQQLDHFAQLMKQTVSTAHTADELAAVIRGRSNGADLTVIDTAGTNPFDIEELKTLLGFVRAVDAEPVLVLPAGLDPLDAQEIAGVYARMGCKRFIATRLDAARRYAGLIMAARPGYLSFAGFSRSPYVADAVEAATPMNFARLLTAISKKHSANSSKELKS